MFIHIYRKEYVGKNKEKVTYYAEGYVRKLTSGNIYIQFELNATALLPRLHPLLFLYNI